MPVSKFIMTSIPGDIPSTAGGVTGVGVGLGVPPGVGVGLGLGVGVAVGVGVGLTDVATIGSLDAPVAKLNVTAAGLTAVGLSK